MKRVLGILVMVFVFFVANTFAQEEDYEFSNEIEFEQEDENYEEVPPKTISKKKKQAKIETEEEEMKLRFGVRGNLGAAGINPSAWSFPGETFEVAMGNSFGVGAFALIPFASIYFVPEISLQHRTPIDGAAIDLIETAIDIPMHFRFRYREENIIYLGIGPFLGIAASSVYEGDVSVNNDNRSRLDYGLTMEIGFRINRNFSIDIRSLGSFASIGFTEFIKDETGENLEGPSTLIQGQIGLNYTF